MDWEHKMPKYIKDAVILGAAVTLIGTAVPAGYKRTYTHLLANNTTGAPITIEIHLSPDAATNSTTTQQFTRAVGAGLTDLCEEVIGAGSNALGGLMAKGNGLSFSFVANDTLA